MTIWLIVLLVILTVCWYEILKTRELVMKRCQQVCAEAQLQFLDQTVAVIADGFGRVQLPRILSWTLPHNAASRRVMEKCGLELHGTTCWKGVEHVWYSLTAGGPADPA